MKYLLTLLSGFEISDGIITHVLVGDGQFREGNPLMAPIVGEGNFLVLKIVGVLICALLLLKMYRRFPKMTVVTASSIVMFYAAVIGWNLSLFFAG